MSFDRDIAKDVVGYICAVLLTLLILPQLVHTYRTKSSVGLSLPFLILNALVAYIFTFYAFLLEELPFIIAEIILSTFSTTLLIMYFKYKEKELEKGKQVVIV